jgi:hypothetical protein
MKLKTQIAAAAVVATLGGATLIAQNVQINGAGATFPNPIYSKWFSEYNKLHSTVQINYQPIGSGGGIRQITERTVFFGATDGPMTQDQMLAAPGKILHLPTVLGAVVPVYNIPGVKQELTSSSARSPSGTIPPSRSSIAASTYPPRTSSSRIGRMARARPTSGWITCRRCLPSSRSASASTPR